MKIINLSISLTILFVNDNYIYISRKLVTYIYDCLLSIRYDISFNHCFVTMYLPFLYRVNHFISFRNSIIEITILVMIIFTCNINYIRILIIISYLFNVYIAKYKPLNLSWSWTLKTNVSIFVYPSRITMRPVKGYFIFM